MSLVILNQIINALNKKLNQKPKKLVIVKLTVNVMMVNIVQHTDIVNFVKILTLLVTLKKVTDVLQMMMMMIKMNNKNKLLLFQKKKQSINKQ